MTGFEDETYSTIFTSLNHSVRRKILKMLSEEPRSFSDMFESLGISSSHFNYHLENLGDLVSKTEEGKYKLSYLGEAAVATMSKVEESPKPSAMKHPSTFFVKNWKPLILVFIVTVSFLVGVNWIQGQALAEMSDENNTLLSSNELLWDCYTSTLISSEDSPISENEAIHKSLQYGKWDSEKLQGMVVEATMVYFKFEVKRRQVTLLQEEIISEIPIARMYEVTEQVTDYSPMSDENSTYRYIWEISVRTFQEHLDHTFSSPPSGIYHVDAVNGEIYPNLYSLMYIDVENE
ncbi:MAG: hypothetical protein CW691_08940 [Candidatus Bathyarchaeum sp.]|nr:MAG: hypothetical protein CW691_08940 [Candidatus Bathyarchaeum sp.]